MLQAHLDVASGTVIHQRILSQGTLTVILYHLGTNLISWASQKQPIVSMSSAEAEYVAATTAACHVVWLRRLLKDMGHTAKDPTSIFCDNSSAIQLSKHNVFHRKIKHIDTHCHFICDLVNDSQIYLQSFGSGELVDMFTKPLGTKEFEYQREHLGIDNVEYVLPVEIKGVC